jgi:hypothetical protein
MYLFKLWGFKITFQDIKLSLEVITQDVYKSYLRRYSNIGIRRSCVKAEITEQLGRSGRPCSVHWLF